MAKVLITGASGQLGREIRKLRMLFPQVYKFTDVDELDLRDTMAIRNYLAKRPAEYIINCAAFTDVDGAESKVEEALILNRNVVANLRDALKEHPGTRIFHISTDYVFPGNSPLPLTEKDKPGPRCTYGKSKLEGEKVLWDHPSALIIRTSWLYSVFGKNFVKGMKNRMDRKEALKVVYDQVGNPTYAEDLARALMQIIAGVEDGSKSFVPGIFHYSNEGVCSWYDFAWEICNMLGCSLRPEPVDRSAFPQVASRPVYAVMSKDKIRKVYGVEVPYWKESLQRCINDLK